MILKQGLTYRVSVRSIKANAAKYLMKKHKRS